ncbi:MAG: right-handed parallel beta-helix repeat-containing protein [Polyangiales bacterium]
MSFLRCSFPEATSTPTGLPVLIRRSPVDSTRGRALQQGNRFAKAVVRTASVALLLVTMSTNLRAQELVTLSPDITIEPGAGLVATDEAVVLDNQSGGVLLETFAGVPAAADIIAYSEDATGDRLIAFGTTVSLPGNLIARPGDVIRFEGSTYQAESVEFDASEAGIPFGVKTDAVSSMPGSSDLLLSFDTTVALPGGLVVADEDLVAWSGSNYSIAFDGSTEGIPGSMDIDAAQSLGLGIFVFSFDTAGSLGGVDFDDEDIMRYDGTNWSLEFDASESNTAWVAADTDAVLVPEPRMGAVVLVAGLFAFFGGLIKRRGRSAPAYAMALLMASTMAMSLSVPASADDGVFEIKHACATHTGCFAGDAPGYPVNLSEAGSYRLTSNLSVPGTGTTRSGIFVIADHIDIDLNGFQIAGDAGSTAGSLEGNGIYSFVASHTRVHNGFIQGMRRNCISLGDHSVIEDVIVYDCAQDGILTGTGSRVVGVVVSEMGDDGIEVGDFSTVEGSIVRFVSDNGIVVGDGATVSANAVSSATDFGLVIIAPNHGASYGHNSFHFNNGGDTQPQVIVAAGSAFPTAPNDCNSGTSCE